MKLKLVVASMSVLGLISFPVFADTQTTTTDTQSTTVATQNQAAAQDQATTTSQTTTTKRTHRHARHARHQYVAANDYKDSGTFKDGAMPVVVVPQVDTYAIIYDSMGQNLGRSKALPDWFNRIGLSGGVNFDAHWGNRSQGYMGENYTRLSLNDAYLNATATVNDWAKAFASLSYSNFSGINGAYLGSYSNAYTNNQLNLEQGYLTIANYEVSPIFLQVGKQYTDYGRYQIHPLERTMTQVMTESLQTSAKLGFITRAGLHGQIYAFDNPSLELNQGHSNSVYGAALGFDQINEALGFDLGIGYMSNITGVNDIQAMLGNSPFATHDYVHLVGGIAVYGDVNSGPFSLSARYTTALQSFNPNDLSNLLRSNLAGGSKPWAADLTAGFNFTGWNHQQNIYVGYQASNNAVNLALPKSRWLVGYNFDYWRNTNLGVEVGHDNAYGTSNGASGNSSNTIGARASVKFG